MQISLYELTEDYRRALDQLADEPDAQKAADILNSIAEPLQDKAVKVALYMRSQDVTEKAIEDEIARLSQHLEAVRVKRDRLRSSIDRAMRIAGVTVIDHPLLTLKYKKNPPSADVLCEADVPAEYWKQPETPPKTIDKRALLVALKNGDVTGACLKQSERLTIG